MVISDLKYTLYIRVCSHGKTIGKKCSNILVGISLNGEIMVLYIYLLWVFPYFPNFLTKILCIDYIIRKIFTCMHMHTQTHILYINHTSAGSAQP